MHKVIIPDNIIEDLKEIKEYIFRFSFSLSIANNIINEIMTKILWLKIFPNMYPVFEWDLRVMTVRDKYRIFYKVDELNRTVTILYIFWTAENYESLIH